MGSGLAFSRAGTRKRRTTMCTAVPGESKLVDLERLRARCACSAETAWRTVAADTRLSLAGAGAVAGAGAGSGAGAGEAARTDDEAGAI